MKKNYIVKILPLLGFALFSSGAAYATVFEGQNKETFQVKEQDKNTSFNDKESISIKKIGLKDVKVTFKNTKNTIPNIKKENEKIIISFDKANLFENVKSNINLSSIGSLAENIEIFKEKERTVFELFLQNNFEFNTELVGNDFIIHVKEIIEKNKEKEYNGKPLSINFQDMEVRAIIQVLADFTGLNIISSDKIQGTMSIRLKNVPWDHVLDLVLESRGLQKVQNGNVIWVATSQEVEENNAMKLALKNQGTELEPLKVEFFQINYYKAEELKAVIESKSENSQFPISLISKRGSIGVDSRNNILFVQDTPTKIEEIRRVIKKLDVANRQVLVEAKIVIADKKFGQDLGVKFGGKYSKVDGNRTLTLNGENNFGASSVNGANPGVLGLTFLNGITGNMLQAELSAIEDNNRGKVLSNPKLLTADNKKATIEQGAEVPYVAPGGTGGASTVQFKKAVLKLDVTPQITPNGKVILNLQIAKDSIGQLVPVAGGGTVPTIDTKKIDTTVTVNNGQTVVLGGVYEIQDFEDIQKIPLLGDIPALGNLFKRSVKSETKGELMIFITPIIVEDEMIDSQSRDEIKIENK